MDALIINQSTTVVSYVCKKVQHESQPCKILINLCRLENFMWEGWEADADLRPANEGQLTLFIFTISVPMYNVIIFFLLKCYRNSEIDPPKKHCVDWGLLNFVYLYI
jgi:hypothetical protein